MSALFILLGQRMRRDWRQLLMWVVGTALLAYLGYVGVAESYASQQDRASLLAAAVANPVILLFRGLPSGAGEGAFMVFLIFPWLAFLAAFMSTFLAVRHSRADEESGRAELVAATPAGHVLPVVATAVHGILADLALAVLTTLAFLGTGSDATGSVVAGFAAGAVGVAFLGVGLLAAQLMQTSRAANSLAVWVVVGSLLVSGFGNAIGTPSDDLTRMESSWLAWLSPFGWGENTRAFADDNPWPMLLSFGFGLALIAIAVALQTVRDMDASFIHARPARAAARAALSSSPALVWRLTWGAILGWGIGGLITGVMSTSLASVVDQIGSENPAVEEIIRAISQGGDVEQGTVVVFFTMLGILAAAAGVQVVIRARQEEAHGTAEPVLTAPVARVRWLADYLLTALAAVVITVAAAAAGAAIGIAAQDGDWGLMKDILVVGGGQVVAAAVFLVLTGLVFVALPRATIAVGWSLVGVGALLGMFGPLFGFPEWTVNLSPLADGPKIAADGSIDANGFWWLVLVVVAGAAASLVLMRRRELTSDG